MTPVNDYTDFPTTTHDAEFGMISRVKETDACCGGTLGSTCSLFEHS